MAVTGDSGGKKKRGGKVFGSLERGLDKVITMLTPSKRRALRDAPRKIKVSKLLPQTSVKSLEKTSCEFRRDTCFQSFLCSIRLNIM